MRTSTTPRTVIIRNIGALITFADPSAPLPTVVEHADRSLVLRDGRIAEILPAKQRIEAGDALVIDAQGGCVVPGLVDCHTHVVWGGSREHEFVQRCEGRSYLEIAQAGGGIMSTVRSVRAASEADLIRAALPRLAEMLRTGTTTAEVKSGYGLTVADEFKMLRVIRELNSLQPIELVPTYLAAHTIPSELKATPAAYLDAVLADEVLALLRDEHLAEFIDVFCEASAFDVAQSRRVLEAGARYGLNARLHADQITQCGASRLAAEVGAVSADHLETVDDEAIELMKRAGVIGVVLPACSFFLGVEQAPARRMLDAGLPLAIATDLNPGSANVASLALTLSIACVQLKLTPAEALAATTVVAARVLQRADRIGVLAPDYQADLLIVDTPNLPAWPYHVGQSRVRMVIKRGQIAFSRST